MVVSIQDIAQCGYRIAYCCTINRSLLLSRLENFY